MKPIDTTVYRAVFKGSYMYACERCGFTERKDEIKEECYNCGRLIAEVKDK